MEGLNDISGPGQRCPLGWVDLSERGYRLHTINVTVPFVKKAIATMSSRLELSLDGKKLVQLKSEGTIYLRISHISDLLTETHVLGPYLFLCMLPPATSHSNTEC